MCWCGDSGWLCTRSYNAGALSLVIVMVCGLFVGGVLGLQGYSNPGAIQRRGLGRDVRGFLVAEGTRAGRRRHCCSPAVPARRWHRKSA
ncbi:MAG: hypothetical protein U5K76_06300 [Woeseiaceae bacterium]|nr:hypothetical protein [Woeseiaceae bacterium]